MPLSPDKNVAHVDPEACTGCGLCARVCLDQIFTINNESAQARGEPCLECGHCVAACPEGAVSMVHGDAWSQEYKHFEALESWLPHGEGNTAELVRLMRSRRSCRNFKDRPVPEELLEDLVRIAVTAPSGTNSQLWTFTLLPTREAVLTLAEPIKAFFANLNRTAEKAWLRKALKLIGKGDLDDYYNSYYAKVGEALRQWEEEGLDRLFHGATAAVLVGMRPGASCPSEDAMLATQNLMLGAHTLGLGSCLIGYAVAAMGKTPAIKDVVSVPRRERIYAVAALGWPAEKYRGVTQRRKPLLRVAG